MKKAEAKPKYKLSKIFLNGVCVWCVGVLNDRNLYEVVYKSENKDMAKSIYECYIDETEPTTTEAYFII